MKGQRWANRDWQAVIAESRRSRFNPAVTPVAQTFSRLYRRPLVCEASGTIRGHRFIVRLPTTSRRSSRLKVCATSGLDPQPPPATRYCGLNVLASAFLIPVLVSLVSLTACVSKNNADARARAAFFAGQQQAAQMARQTQIQGPTVSLVGEVRNPVVRWTADLTLAKAVVAADYYGSVDPTEIVIQREGQENRYDPKTLLGGQDVQLEPNDVILLRH